ncbi:hypothetical protein GYMLUDRAFT_71058 [Collybiopsis luxurians FD-317 M1]|nr:hypothetical protein GYMLUDRAFT_71058 [Collybiopsis luxurians FD-317 M1]
MGHTAGYRAPLRPNVLDVLCGVSLSCDRGFGLSSILPINSTCMLTLAMGRFSYDPSFPSLPIY